MTDLDHLLDRARHGVLLPAEGEVLADQVQRLRDARPVSVTPAMVRAAGEALEDECLTRRGHDLGTIHRDDIARAALEAALAAGAVAGRQAGAQCVPLAASTLQTVPTTPPTAPSGPQGASRGPDGDREGDGPRRASGGRTATQGHIRIGQVYVACHPLDEGRRIRVVFIGAASREGQIRVEDADTGQRPRWIKAATLHASGRSRTGRPRRSGYALEESP